MALLDSFNLAANALFKSRLQMSLSGMAQTFYLEAQGTAGHGKRAQLATAVITNPAAYVAAFANYIATDGTVAAAAGTVTTGTADVQQALVTDSMINNSVASVWNAMAGV